MPPAGLAMRPVNAAAQLADAQTGRKEAAKVKKNFVGIRCCTPRMRGPHTPAKDFVLCTPIRCLRW